MKEAVKVALILPTLFVTIPLIFVWLLPCEVCALVALVFWQPPLASRFMEAGMQGLFWPLERLADW